MLTRVTVALVGDPETALVAGGGLRHPEDWEMPYVERAKRELDVADDERLSSIVQRALEAFDVRVAGDPDWNAVDRIAFIAFYKPEDERSLQRLRPDVTLVDSEGRARWEPFWQRVAYREILRAGEAGALDGDPRRPYLILQPGIGNGLLADWQTLVTVWDAFWYVMTKALAGYAGVKAYQELKERFGRGPEVVGGHYAEWQERGARPDNMDRFLSQKLWHEADLGELLGVTTDEAIGFLSSSGYWRRENGLWECGADEAAKLLHGNLEFMVHTAMTTRRDAAERVLRERTERFLETGAAPEVDWDELGQLPRDEVGFRDPEEVAAQQAAHRPGRLRRLWWRIRYPGG